MRELIYGEQVGWYRLLDPPQDHLDEAECFRAAFQRAVVPAPVTLLELGAGGGHNAWHLKRQFRCVLTDLSPDMVALSRELNPECEHAVGDLRTLRLERSFEAVLLHDAIAYMTTEHDLRAAALTAFVHTRPGGAAIFAPDALRETFKENTQLIETQAGERALRGLIWT
jgi:trans-aconitate methyltransferase